MSLHTFLIKNLCEFSLIVVLVTAFYGCTRPHTAKIVAVYQDDVSANDGCVVRQWFTTTELDNGGRVIRPGIYGATGDVFTLFFTPGEGFNSNP
jgi:hypothetical protein